jgi:hypothetical protein
LGDGGYVVLDIGEHWFEVFIFVGFYVFYYCIEVFSLHPYVGSELVVIISYVG